MVIIAADVGYLTIKGIDVNPEDRSIGQIASYMSLLLSVGNIFASMAMTRHQRTVMDDVS